MIFKSLSQKSEVAIKTKNRFNRFSAALVCVWIIIQPAHARHFKPVPETGTSQPVVIQNAEISGNQIEPGDEIAVFDGSLCVGAAVYQETFPVTIAAWIEVPLPDNTILPGAKVGHTMIFKIWQKSSRVELNATPVYSSASTGRFNETLTVLSSLTAEKIKTPQKFSPVDSTGDARPIVIQNALIEDQPIVTGDEIAVFDDTICAGAVVFQGTFPVTIAAWMEVPIPDGTFLPGAKANHSMNFKIWQNQDDIILDAVPEYSVGAGTFGETLTAVSLSATLDTYVSYKEFPNYFILKQNYPNPFNSETTIQYQLPSDADMAIDILNTTCHKICTILNQHQKAGNHSVVWNGTNNRGETVSSGVYFYRIQINSKNRSLFVKTKKMILLK